MLNALQESTARSNIVSAISSFLTCIDASSRTDSSFRQVVASLCADFLMSLGVSPEEVVTRVVEERVRKREQLGYRDIYGRTPLELVLAEHFYVSDVVEGLLEYIKNMDEAQAKAVGGLVLTVWQYCHWGKTSEARLQIERELARHIATFLITQHKALQIRRSVAGPLPRIVTSALASIARAVSVRRRRRRGGERPT